MWSLKLQRVASSDAGPTLPDQVVASATIGREGGKGKGAALNQLDVGHDRDRLFELLSFTERTLERIDPLTDASRRCQNFRDQLRRELEPLAEVSKAA